MIGEKSNRIAPGIRLRIGARIGSVISRKICVMRLFANGSTHEASTRPKIANVRTLKRTLIKLARYEDAVIYCLLRARSNGTILYQSFTKVRVKSSKLRIRANNI